LPAHDGHSARRAPALLPTGIVPEDYDRDAARTSRGRPLCRRFRPLESLTSQVTRSSGRSHHLDRSAPCLAKGPTTNIAGRIGRWSARHRKTAIFGWLAFIVLSVADERAG
jgi:hypothetical protein